MNEEKINPSHYHDDPEPKNYSNVVIKYGDKIPAPLLENLIIDLDWFILNISEGLMLPDEHYPTMDEIVDSLYNTGKYEFENDRYKITGTLSLENKSYKIIINPEFFADEYYFSDSINYTRALLEDNSKSQVSFSSVKKEIILRYPNMLNANMSIN